METDWPSIIREITGLITAIGMLITIALGAWIKFSQNKNAIQSSLEKQQIKEEITKTVKVVEQKVDDAKDVIVQKDLRDTVNQAKDSIEKKIENIS